MEIALVLVSIIGIIVLVFILTHLRPLTEDEVRELGTKRRKKQIRQYFSFDKREFTANKKFKKRMKPSGRFYQMSESLHEFPAIAAALLKYKKHEWIIVAFERNKEIFLTWLNKGLNRLSVSSYLSTEDMAKVADAKRVTSVLTFHNHPNPDPDHLDCTKPSDQDIEIAKGHFSVLNEHGVNLVSFVCERGRHYKYFLWPADSFLPLPQCIEEIDEVNGQSRLKNLSLHFERIF
jgi:hypothetical protein